MSDLHSLLDLPETVSKNAFVVQLASGVQNPASVLDNYAITPDLVRAFDQALSLVRGAVDSRRSTAAYVHGSFGSGKSHFLSVLSLMLSPDSEHQARVWRDPELAELKGRHRWLEGKRVLRLHFNMVGATSLEDRVFPGYVEQVRKLHPDASLPGLFLDSALFDNAKSLCDKLGDEAFFAPMNAGTTSSKAAWGARGGAATWTRERFDRAVASDAIEERRALFTALVRAHFPAWLESKHGYVSFDRGLGELTRHARSLGYEAVVVFFDEMILWLAGGAADRKWLNGEIQKLAKMVDTDDADRPLALVSFVARQRDISELVGDQYAGGDAQALRDSMKWWEGRFNTITLPDRNLPAIVRKRVVRPKDEAAATRLRAAFDDLRRKLGTSAWQTLLGEIGDGDESFAKVYPFSPALVEVLVAMSATLQRERTALRLLMEVLVRHMEDFELGKLVPVGDLFDPLAGGEDPMDGVMRERFQSARRLYQNELLPVIQQENRTATPDKCQRLRDAHAPELGCSNCRESRCRTDNRLVKTLLLGALVPNTPSLKDLTITRLVALNHGTLRAPIPNTEGPLAAERLRKYAGHVGKLRVGDQKDPSVHVVLEGVDLKPILESARQYDQPGARKSKLRELLFTAFGFTRSDMAEYPTSVEWRGTNREGSVYFGNVREMDEGRFRVKPEHDFRIVIDYPFDEPGRTPQEDETRLGELRERLEERTVVWLPDFFSEAVQNELGQLVVLDEILRGESWKEYLKHLRLDDQQRTKQELESLQNQKKNRLLSAIAVAYNVASGGSEQLDPTRRVQEHFHVLLPERRVSNLSVTRLEGSIDSLASALLAECYPRHPDFRSKVTGALLAASARRFVSLCEREGRREVIDKGDRREYELAQGLGLVQLSESNVAVRDEAFTEIDRAVRGQHTTDKEITVGGVRRVIDPHKLRGLTREVEDFVVIAYAAYTARELRSGTRTIDEPKCGSLSDDATLVATDLPSADDWERALTRAGALFGIAIGSRALRAKNVNRLARDLVEAATKFKADISEIPSLLHARERLAGASNARRDTADEALRLVDTIVRAEREGPVATVKALAAFASAKPDARLARAIESAPRVRATLANSLLWHSIEAMLDRAEGDCRELVAEAREVLAADEDALSLVTRSKALHERVESILSGDRRRSTEAPHPPTEPASAVAARSVPREAPTKSTASHGEARGATLREAIARAREALDALEASDDPNGPWIVRWTIDRG
ncbi:MAG: hypothetical protein JNK05_04435 [Myxococcales bacterium]|nr:hypothetical protein [Myxococcales bacterium]